MMDARVLGARAVVVLFGVFPALVIPTLAQAKPGDLDRSFGKRGKVTTDVTDRAIAATTATAAPILTAWHVAPYPRRRRAS